ncbi:hypothetical protein J5N97_027006 [Dioscorea zingiberensis]|uniref:Uncharacterized protein n=1 Tax=Dioscorea zingiberensis TaxID=325984 RepID=A0A9D5H791_9LILI|nr:hypothetical protein J5N97_027006 [Dioscorea zingiberensis]
MRLAGLLLATKFCVRETIKDSVVKGMGSGVAGVKVVGRSREVYLEELAVTVLAAFCRVPEIASSRGDGF